MKGGVSVEMLNYLEQMFENWNDEHPPPARQREMREFADYLLSLECRKEKEENELKQFLEVS